MIPNHWLHIQQQQVYGVSEWNTPARRGLTPVRRSTRLIDAPAVRRWASRYSIAKRDVDQAVQVLNEFRHLQLLTQGYWPK